MSTSSARSSAPSNSSFLRLAVTGEAGLLLLAWGLGRWLDVAPLQQLRLSLGGLLWGVVATIPPLVALAWMLTVPQGAIRRLVALVVDQFGGILAQRSIAELAGLAALAGLSEEVLFRGVIQPGMGRWLSQGWAVLATSLIFGLVHFASRAYAVFAALMGLYLGILLLTAGNLLAPLITHGLYDFIALVWVARRYRASYAKPPVTA